MGDENNCSLLSRKREFAACNNRGTDEDELKYFRSFLRWSCVDQSSAWRVTLSWSIFFLLVIIIPIISHFFYSCSDCDQEHQRSYDGVVQLSLSVFSAISFLSLTSWFRKYGLARFLFLDKLSGVSDNVRQEYSLQFSGSLKILSAFILPCFAAEIAYKLWWYITGADEITYYGNIYASDIITCALQWWSWLYRTSVFFFVCILYRLICYLQILRMDDFAQVFEKENDVGSILKEHLTIRRTLRIISHRFRGFILLSLLLVTVSQLAAILSVTRSTADVNFFKAGELVLCSISLVAGLFICLRSSTKITHKAQSITCLAAKWHVCCTIDSFDMAEGETPSTRTYSQRVFPSNWESEDEEEADGEDALDNTKMGSYAHTISFQKRQALVTYLENNKAGITVYGFMLDRSWLHTICGIQLTLLLWLLNKTVGFS